LLQEAWSQAPLFWQACCTPGSFPTSTPSPGTCDLTTPEQVSNKTSSVADLKLLILDQDLDHTCQVITDPDPDPTC